MLVVDPLLADRVADAHEGSTKELPAKRCRVDDRSDVPDGEVLEDVVLAGLSIDLDFGEPCDEGKRLAVVRVVVAGHAHQALTGQRGR